MNILLYPFLAVIKILAALLGLVAVALALPFSKETDPPELPEGVERIVYEGWSYRELPNWANWIWGNNKYGSLGNWFWVEYDDPKKFLSQYKWLAIRNPANNLNQSSLFTLRGRHSVKVWGDEEVNDVKGKAGISITRAGGKYGFYCILPYGSTGRSLRIRLGYKIDPLKEVQNASFSILVNPFARFGS